MDLGHGRARVLVTGSGANIGRGIGLRFAREGARVLLVVIDVEQAERVAAQALQAGAADALPLGLDLTAEGAGTRPVDAAMTAWDGLDVLVNNVGWSPRLLLDADRHGALAAHGRPQPVHRHRLPGGAPPPAGVGRAPRRPRPGQLGSAGRTS